MAAKAQPTRFEIGPVTLKERMQLHRLMALTDVRSREENRAFRRALEALEHGDEFDLETSNEDVIKAHTEALKARLDAGEAGALELSIENIETILKSVDAILKDDKVIIEGRRAGRLRRLDDLFQALEAAKAGEKHPHVRSLPRYEADTAEPTAGGNTTGEKPAASA